MAKRHPRKKTKNEKSILFIIIIVGIAITLSIIFNSKKEKTEIKENNVFEISTTTTTSKVQSITTTTTSSLHILNRNYNIIATPSKTFRMMTFSEGENYLKEIGFSQIETRNYADDMQGYFASYKPYSNLEIFDNIEIIIENDHILLSTITLVYLEKDLNVSKIYNDLKLLNSAFNGYTISRSAVDNVYNSVKLNNDRSISNFNDEFITFSLTAQIERVNSQSIYTFKLDQYIDI